MSTAASFLSVILMGLMSGAVLAQAGTTQQSLLPIADYPHVNKVAESFGINDDYVLPLSSYKKVNGLWRHDRQFRLSGNLHRQTLELHRGQDLTQVYTYFLEQFSQWQGRRLFSCQSFDCGSSNAWANNHFSEKLLYGREEFQQYSVIEIRKQNNAVIYASIYGVIRGNKRSYIHIELLETEQTLDVPSDPVAIFQQLMSEGYYTLPLQDVELELQPVADVHLQPLALLMRQKPRLSIAIVGHNTASGTVDEQIERGKNSAQEVFQWLLDTGIKSDRLALHSVGGLAPRGWAQGKPAYDSRRIEVVLIE